LWGLSGVLPQPMRAGGRVKKGETPPKSPPTLGALSLTPATPPSGCGALIEAIIAGARQNGEAVSDPEDLIDGLSRSLDPADRERFMSGGGSGARSDAARSSPGGVCPSRHRSGAATVFGVRLPTGRGRFCPRGTERVAELRWPGECFGLGLWRARTIVTGRVRWKAARRGPDATEMLVHRHIQKIQGPLSTPTIGTAEVSSWASQREAKPPLHLLSESVH
jgi:hypothetical protein